MGSSCATALIVVATILGPITLVFMAVSFGTDHWLEFSVDRSMLTKTERDASTADWKMGLYYHSRDRGMFRECYEGNDTAFLDNAPDSEVIDGNCFEIDYDQPSDVHNPSDYYDTRIHLNRCFLAFFILAMVLFLMAYVFGLILCCMRISRWAYVAGLFSYSSAFSLAAAIAFFHGAEYIERNKLEGNEAYLQQYYSQWSETLKNATDRDYGWSYALGWVGMILAAITATLYSIAGCYLTGERYEDREYLEKNRARDFPIAMEPVYAVGGDPYYGKSYHGYPRAYVNPVVPYAGGYPAIAYGEPPKEMWQWREVES